MSFSIDDNAQDVMNEINMTPLVDVMLVLLIVFIITVPAMKHAVAINLPQASAAPMTKQPDALQLTIDAQGIYRLDNKTLDSAELAERLAGAAALSPQPALHVQGDQAVRYEHVALVMAAARRAGLTQVGLLTLPAP
jgi:biopolymer transport protein ExbD